MAGCVGMLIPSLSVELLSLPNAGRHIRGVYVVFLGLPASFLTAFPHRVGVANIANKNAPGSYSGN